MVIALHKWLISFFWETAEASNSQTHSVVVPESIYIVTGNDIIGYFRSAANRIGTPMFKHFFAALAGFVCEILLLFDKSSMPNVQKDI